MFNSTNDNRDKNKNNKTTEVKISNISINTQISTTSEGIKGSINNQINLNGHHNDNNNSINITQTILIDESNVNPNNEIKQDNNKININNNDTYAEEIVRKTDNPYEIPEDF